VDILSVLPMTAPNRWTRCRPGSGRSSAKHAAAREVLGFPSWGVASIAAVRPTMIVLFPSDRLVAPGGSECGTRTVVPPALHHLDACNPRVFSFHGYVVLHLSRLLSRASASVGASSHVFSELAASAALRPLSEMQEEPPQQRPRALTPKNEVKDTSLCLRYGISSVSVQSPSCRLASKNLLCRCRA